MEFYTRRLRPEVELLNLSHRNFYRYRTVLLQAKDGRTSHTGTVIIFSLQFLIGISLYFIDALSGSQSTNAIR